MKDKLAVVQNVLPLRQGLRALLQQLNRPQAIPHQQASSGSVHRVSSVVQALEHFPHHAQRHRVPCIGLELATLAHRAGCAPVPGQTDPLPARHLAQHCNEPRSLSVRTARLTPCR
ncbi:hypothetical protein D9M69_568150 [compost metagenome]